ncbi:MAG: hypothetical protein ACF8PN_13875 [Phycisphaerales bacterium]
MGVTALIMVAMVSLTPPLSEAARTALDSAVDGLSLRIDAAIEMLLLEPTPEAPLPLDEADWGRVEDESQNLRGVAYQLEGVVVSREADAEGFSNAEVWLIRPGFGPDYAVIITAPTAEAPLERTVRTTFHARFVMWAETPVRAHDGDRQMLATPVFVGSVAAVTPVDSMSYESPIWIACILACVAAFGLAKAWSRRSSPAAPRFTGVDESADEAFVELPEEPAEALAELHRRSDPT